MNRIERIKALKEITRTLGYFLCVQVFIGCTMLMISKGNKTIFGILIGVPPILAWLKGSRRSNLFVFYYICLLFSVGGRTIYLGEHIRLVPSEILLWILGAVVMLSPDKRPPSFRSSKFAPSVLWLLMVGAVWGIALNKYNPENLNSNVNMAIGFAKGYFLAMPVFFVTSRLINRTDDINKIFYLINAQNFFLCFLAIAEYYNFGFVKHFSGFLSADAGLTAEGFRRAGISFWGGPSMVMVLILYFPLILAHFFNTKTLFQRGIIGTSLWLTIVTFYIAGHRGAWIAAAIAIVVYFYVKGIKWIVFVALLISFTLPFIPNIAKVRMQTLYGKTEDSSARIRGERARLTLDLIKKNPITGAGWAAAGLAHTETFQLWSDAGLGAFLGFVGLFWGLLCRLFNGLKKIKYSSFPREYLYGFIATLISFFFVVSTQTFFNLPEQYPPLWIIMALAFRYPLVAYREQQEALWALKQTDFNQKQAEKI